MDFLQEPLDEVVLEDSWIDHIPLSMAKDNFAGDFSDGVTPAMITKFPPPAPKPKEMETTGQISVDNSTAANKAMDHLASDIQAAVKMTTQQEQMSKCVRLCQEYFGGAWRKVLGSQMDSSVKPLSGGLSNFLYIANLPEGMEAENGEPKTVLIRFYGTAQGDHTAILKDSLVYALLAERGWGPKLYSCFAEGRFEEYIPTRCLRTPELAYPEHMADIASTLATLHQTEMPLCKEPNFLKDTVTKYMNEVKNNMHIIVQKPLWKDIAALNLNFEKELEWLIDVFSCSSSDVRFCHNDLQGGNILKGFEARKLLFIDFEFAAYNYRGFDLANHFLQWCYRYDVSVPPYFSENLENYPTIDQQRTFFHHYLAACGIVPTEAEIHKLYLETQLFIMGPHFVSACWALKSVIRSPINFDYLEFALVKLRAYKRQKEYLQRTRPFLLEFKKYC